MTAKIKKILVYLFISITFVLSVFSVILNFDFNKSGVHATEATYDARGVFDFNSGWRFSKGEGNENVGSRATVEGELVTTIHRTYIPNDNTTNSTDEVWENDYQEGDNGETWTDVSLPHTYNDVDTFDNFVETKNNTNAASYAGERSVYSGTAWYKKTFFLPEEYRNKRIYIEFEAARQSAQIWVNGVAINGTYLNGFVAFGYELDGTYFDEVSGETKSILNYGSDGENIITVLVDNSYPYYMVVDGTEFKSMYGDGSTAYSNTASNPIVWHDSHWQPNYGGLYQNSYLYVTNKLQLTLPLYSFLETEGTYIYTSNENGDDKTATINIKSQVSNGNATSQMFDFIATVKDMSGAIVGSVSMDSITLPAGAMDYVTASVNIRNVKRWSPDYPYLYTVECALFQDGECIDNNSDEIGVRTFKATTDGGFLINENYLYLNGWGQKSTNEWAAIGAAQPNWLQEYTFKQMKDAGANYVRFGHTAGGAAQIESCEKLGLIVTQPGVDGEGGYAAPVQSYSLSYNINTYNLRVNTFKDMLIYFRNSPAILFWEIGNQGADGISSGSNGYNCLESIRALVDEYDYGNRVDSDSDGNIDKPLNYGTVESSRTKSTRLCTIRKGNATSLPLCEVCETTLGTNDNVTNGLPLLEGEYNRLEARRGFWDIYTEAFAENGSEPAYSPTVSTENIANYSNVSSEVFCVKTVEKYYSELFRYTENGYMGTRHMGGANWIFSDSNSHARVLSEVCRTSGEVDAMRLEKDVYYVNQVLYSNSVKTHIIGHWNYPAGTTKTVYVVSKAPRVDLSVPNGSGGYTVLTSSSPTNKYLFTFPDITWNSGTITATGYGENGLAITGATDSIVTAGEPAGLRITNNVVNPNGLLANGSDYLILDVEVVDANGNRVADFDGEYENAHITFSIQNENITSVWRGGYNSSLEQTINSKYLYPEAGICRVVLRTTQTAGDISVNAVMNGFMTIYHTVSNEIEDAGTVSQEYNYSLKSLSVQNDLSELTEPGYNTISFDTVIINPTDASRFVNSIECYGYENSDDFLYEIHDFTVGYPAYADLECDFTSIPTQYKNAEYILTSNSIFNKRISSMYAFTIKQNCVNVLIFPINASIPNWVTEQGYTLSDNHFLISEINGGNQMFCVYEKELFVGDDITYLVGPTNASNNKSYMYILGFYKNIQGGQSYAQSIEGGYVEPFNGLSNGLDFVNNEFNSNSYSIIDNDGNGTGITVTQDAVNNCITLYDAVKSSKVGGFCMPINASKFTFKFDFWTDATRISNEPMKYTRLLFQNSTEYDSTDVNANGYIRLYFDSSKDSTNANYANYVRWGSTSNSSTQTINYPSGTNCTIPTNTWYTYKIDVDLANNTFTISYKNQSANDEAYSVLFHRDDTSVFTNFPSIDSVENALFVTGGNGYGNVKIANVSLTKETVSTQASGSITAVKIGAATLTNNFLTYINADGPQSISFDYLTTSYKMTNLVSEPSISSLEVIIDSDATYKSWIDSTQKVIYVSVNDGYNNGTKDLPNVTTYKIYYELESQASPTIQVFGVAVKGFNKNTDFYYMGEYNAISNPMPTTMSDFSCNFGTIMSMSDTSTMKYIRLKKISISVAGNDGVNYNYDFSYFYGSEFVVHESKYAIDVIDFDPHEDWLMKAGSLYENNNLYTNANFIIYSVPYKFSGAEYFLMNNRDFNKKYRMSPRSDGMAILLVHTHDILGTQSIAGWINTGEVVTTDAGYVYTIFAKELSEGTFITVDFRDFSDFSFTPILGIKSIEDITNQVFLSENFTVLDKNNRPFLWEVHDTESGCSVDVETVAGSEALVLSDASFHVGSQEGNKAYVTKNFSTITNRFEFETSIYVYSTGNQYKNSNGDIVDGVNYIRLWLLDGDMNAENYTTDVGKNNVGIEAYLHETAGVLKLEYRQFIGSADDKRKSNYTSNTQVAFSNLKKDVWLDIRFSVNPQLKKYTVTVSYTYHDEETDQDVEVDETTGEIDFLYRDQNCNSYTVSQINTLAVGTSANQANHFAIGDINVRRVRESVISNITINGDNITSYDGQTEIFDQLTRDYLYILGEEEYWPTVFASLGVQGDEITSIQKSSDSLYIEIIGMDLIGQSNDIESYHTYRIYIYANSSILSSLVESLRSKKENDQDLYLITTWDAFLASFEDAENLIASYSHNYDKHFEAYNNLNEANEALVRAYYAHLVYDETQAIVIINQPSQNVAGDIVSVEIMSMQLGYRFDRMTVTDLMLNPIPLLENGQSFVMPEENVVVTVLFKEYISFYIGGGKIYDGLNQSTQNLSITPKSSITTKIDAVYIPANYLADFSISFVGLNSWQFPSGTKITLVDRTNSNPSYYYYSLNSNLTTIYLTDFIPMGKVTGNYEYKTNDVEITEIMYFIFDFSNANLISGGEIEVVYRYNSGEIFNVSKTVMFALEDEESSLTINDIEANSYKKDEIKFTTNVVIGENDLYCQENGLSVVITLEGGSEFPQGSVIKCDNIIYPISANQKYVSIPILGNGVYDISIVNMYEAFVASSVTYICQLYCSSVEGYHVGGDIVGQDSIARTNLLDMPNTAVDVSMGLQDRVLTTEDDSIDFEINYNQDTLNSLVELQVMKKIEGVYLECEETYSCGNGVTTANLTEGKIDLSGLLTAVDGVTGLGNKNLSLNYVAGTLTSGTYRIVISVTDGSGKINTARIDFIIR